MSGLSENCEGFSKRPALRTANRHHDEHLKSVAESQVDAMGSLWA